MAEYSSSQDGAFESPWPLSPNSTDALLDVYEVPEGFFVTSSSENREDTTPCEQDSGSKSSNEHLYEPSTSEEIGGGTASKKTNMKRALDVDSPSVPAKVILVDTDEKFTELSEWEPVCSDSPLSEDIMSKSEKKLSLPSQITDRAWIHVFAPTLTKKVPKTTHIEIPFSQIKEYKTLSGKWLIYSNRVRTMPGKNMTYHDYAWSCIQNLVENNPYNVTGLTWAKASTAWGSQFEVRANSSGVICCYTGDYSDKNLAKKAADAVRKAYDCGGDMFYKTDNDTSADKYTHMGARNVSLYKHTVANELFERDSECPSMWKLVCL